MVDGGGDDEKSPTFTSFFSDIVSLFIARQIVLNINFSSRTTSLDVQNAIEAVVEKRTKNIFGPPVGKKLIAFIDDMNMPKLDDYGTQQPIALLKLLLEQGGMYDRGKELNWKFFKDLREFYLFSMEMGVGKVLRLAEAN